MTKSIKNNVSHFEEYSRIKKAIAEMENVTSNTKGALDLCCKKVYNIDFEEAVNTFSFPKANFSSLCLNNTNPIETNDSDEVDAEKEAQIVMDYLFPENDQQHCVFVDNEGTAAAVVKVRDAEDPSIIRLMVIIYSSYNKSFILQWYTKRNKKALMDYLYDALNYDHDKIEHNNDLNALYSVKTKSFILEKGKVINQQTGEVYTDLAPLIENHALEILETAKNNCIPIRTAVKKTEDEIIEYYSINKAAVEEANDRIARHLALLAAGGFIYKCIYKDNKYRYYDRVTDEWSIAHSKSPDKKDKRESHILIRKDMLSPEEVTKLLEGAIH